MTENLKLIHADEAPRVELHDLLGLTGAEVSINNLPAGAAVPFVHSHRQNEEVYLVLQGSGKLYVDGGVLPIKAGDCFRISPEGQRAIAADKNEAIGFICIQTKQNSLENFTMKDAVINNSKAPWHN